MKKKLIIIGTLILLLITGATAGIGYWYMKWQHRQIWQLNKEIKRLSEYKEKESRIQKMEKALLVCFDLSAIEAHYYSIIYDDFAIKYGIPWEIYPAVIRIESNFDPTLRSSKDAKGIAQVLESTAKEVSEKLGISYKPSSTLWNDFLCLVIGFTYLSDAIREKGLEDGMKAYLGGPGFDAGRKDIGEYRTTVRKEYERLRYVYKGVLYDSLGVSK